MWAKPSGELKQPITQPRKAGSWATMTKGFFMEAIQVQINEEQSLRFLEHLA